MSSSRPARALMLGASGRLGQALLGAWPVDAARPLCQTRRGAGDTLADETLVWDILNAPAPALLPIGGVIVLAGVTGGSPDDLALNTALAQAGADLGAALGVPVLTASSQAVYGPQQGLLREDAALRPVSDYGRAKVAMEQAVTGPHVTHLRIGNVAGCDALAAGIARGGVVLDRFADGPIADGPIADGQGPRRAMIGPADLARVLLALLAADARPPVLNVARPGTVAMADLLTAAGIPFDWRPAPQGALRELALDVTLLQGICPLPPADARAMAVQGGYL